MRANELTDGVGLGEAVLPREEGVFQRLRDQLVALSLSLELPKLLTIAVQLGLIVLVGWEFRIESRAFYRDLMLVTFFGFLVHAVLPRRYKLPFFVAVSLAALAIIFGAQDSAWMVGIGLVLIGLCHLPIRFGLRIVAVLAAGALLALMRTDVVASPWSVAIWPIVGSMFMFRLIVYIYDLRHEKGPTDPWRTLSYFFLLPNACFPLFPVVDYSTFKRTYYDEDAFAIYQRGVQWIFRGMIHLIIYRFVDAYVMLPQDEIGSMTDLARHFVATYLLYLKVSGQFHIIVGILHLFGFRLPETHNLYYLASSFNDFWRRINIYWKDFVMKIFFNPTYFKVRKRGTKTALVISVLVTFFATWALHSYQWFWLRGSVLFSWPDVLFWGILALILVGNTLYEHTHGRSRVLDKPAWSVLGTVWLALRTAGTFAVICLLWSLWGSPTVTDWLVLWTYPAVTWEGGLRLLGAAVVGTIVLGLLASWAARRGAGRVNEAPASFPRTAAVTGASILLVYLAGHPFLTSRLGQTGREVATSLQSVELNRREAAMLQRGYYEDLVGVKSFNSELWGIYMKRPADWVPIEKDETIVLTHDLRKYELRPSFGAVRQGVWLEANRWGMRDQDCALAKPPGTHRIALLGSSQIFGAGLTPDQPFEAIVEDRLNLESSGQPRYEIMNFSVPGWDPIQQVTMLDKVLSFEPDSLYLVGHKLDVRSSIQHLAEAVRDGVDIPYDDLSQIARAASVEPNTVNAVAESRLNPYGMDIQAWAFHRIAEACRAHNVRPVYILLATIADSKPGSDEAKLLRLAEDAGFEIVDLSRVYVGQDLDSLKRSDWDWHPNVQGHQLIAEQLYRALREGQLVPPPSTSR
jgi:D-alanyl-lipoteichoic acid acyltransferase DltB (MBOAT superfamily)